MSKPPPIPPEELPRGIPYVVFVAVVLVLGFMAWLFLIQQ